MDYCKRALLWLTTILLGISLTGCFEMKSHLKVFPSGEAEMVTTVDTSRMDEIGRSFNDTSSITCEKFIENMKNDREWGCEQTAPSKIKAQRHYSRDEAAAFMDTSNVLFAHVYKVYPSILIGPLSKDENESNPAGNARNAAMLKGFGAVMTLELEMPGEIVAIGNNKPANSAGTQSIDLLDPLVWTEGYSIESKEWSLATGIGLVILAALAIGAGFLVNKKESLPTAVRKYSMPVALSIALLIVILPTLLGSSFASLPEQGEKNAPVASSAPVPAPVPEAGEAPPLAPLESTTISNWNQYADQHPIDVMVDANLEPRFRQVLGNDYEFVKNAVSTATPTVLDAGYVIGSGMAPHSGAMDTAIWAIDTQNGQIYAVWRQDSQIKVYGTPHEQRLPARLYRWYKEMGGPN